MWTYNNTYELYHYGVPGMRWGFHRGRRYNSDGTVDRVLDYTGKRISKYYSKKGYRGGQTPGTSALLPAVVSKKPNTVRKPQLPAVLSSRSMTVPTSKLRPNVINAGSKFMSKKLKIGLTVAALTTTAAVTAGIVVAKKKKAKKEEN